MTADSRAAHTADLRTSLLPIVEDLFTAMVDGEPGLLTPGPADAGAAPSGTGVRARVDIVGPHPSRLTVTTARPTADRLARALLQMGADEPVTLDDVRDAVGEVANVVGGNLKGTLPEGARLTLPVVDVVDVVDVVGDGGLDPVPGATPDTTHPATHHQHLRWRGEPLVLSLWTPTNGEEL